jgi:hypothetical protein
VLNLFFRALGNTFLYIIKSRFESEIHSALHEISSSPRQPAARSEGTKQQERIDNFATFHLFSIYKFTFFFPIYLQDQCSNHWNKESIDGRSHKETGS